MLNFGLTDLRLVAPARRLAQSLGGPGRVGRGRRAGARAGVRQRRRSGGGLRPCLCDHGAQARRWSCRSSRPRRRAREVHGNDGPSAFLFGAERSGLETEEVALAGKIVTVPVNPDFRSLNLAQAVILIAYEWSKHRRARRADRGRTGRAARAAGASRRADRAALRGAGGGAIISTRPTARRRPATRSAPSSPRPAGRPARSRRCAASSARWPSRRGAACSTRLDFLRHRRSPIQRSDASPGVGGSSDSIDEATCASLSPTRRPSSRSPAQPIQGARQAARPARRQTREPSAIARSSRTIGSRLGAVRRCRTKAERDAAKAGGREQRQTHPVGERDFTEAMSGHEARPRCAAAPGQELLIRIRDTVRDSARRLTFEPQRSPFRARLHPSSASQIHEEVPVFRRFACCPARHRAQPAVQCVAERRGRQRPIPTR